MNEPLADVRAARRRVLRVALFGAATALAGERAGAAGPAGREATASDAGASHFPFGPVQPPRALPAFPLLTHQGKATDLGAMLRGHVTALQLMFTGCSATCPIQGALFMQAQQVLQGEPSSARVPALMPVQWLSLSIDPLADGPPQLAAWLRKFEAGPAWLAAAPRVGDVEPLIALLGSGGERRPRGTDPHTGQVYIVNRQGELAFRTSSLPTPATIIEALHRIGAKR